MRPLWLVEKPDLTVGSLEAETYTVQGWIAVDPASDVEDLQISDPTLQSRLSLSTKRRPDVEDSLKVKGIGFGGQCKREHLGNRDFIELSFSNKGARYEIIAPTIREVSEPQTRKAEKLARIREHLRCPRCESNDLAGTETELRCERCSATFRADKQAFDFLIDDFRDECSIIPTDNISSGEYDGAAMNLIHRHCDGLLLDCGAGQRSKYFPNVVNFEITKYPSTDVLGVGERLPFQDNTFDAVFSFAVLEHVKDPFRCASELIRVLKPGGDLYCQVPFLAPFHGYPDHYYNMTQRGLEQVFERDIDIEKLDVLNLGQPIFHLTWFLQLYVAGLPAKVRKKFERMRIRDLLSHGDQYLGKEFVTELSEQAQTELGCVNYLMGKKKGS